MNTFIRGPSYNAYKNSKNIDNELGYTPSTIYKNSKNIERTLFWLAKIKTLFLSKNVKIDPQEDVIRPPLYYLQKLKKYWTNSVLMGEN